MTKYTCKICDYGTDRSYNYNVHMKSKKHILNVDKQKKNNNVICEYCEKEIKGRQNVNRHYSTCKEKRIVDLEKGKESRMR